MKPSERIRLIREISKALVESEDYGDIDLILRQYGFPVADVWNGTPRSYVQAMIEAGGDRDLAELHSFLYPAVDEDVAETESHREAEIWTPRLISGERFFRLFISHTHHHKTEVGALKAELVSRGVSAFVAHQDIEPTREWVDVILAALRTCDALAAYLTEQFHDSRWTDQEIGFCVARRVLLIPIHAGAVPYGFIGRYQAVRGATDDPSRLADDLVRILRSHDATKHAMAEAVVDRFCHAFSYNNARETLKLIETIPAELWTPETIDRVRSAASDNRQIYEADLGFGRSTVAAEAVALVDRVRAAV